MNPFRDYYSRDTFYTEKDLSGPYTLDRNTPDVVQPIDSAYALRDYPNIVPFYDALYRISDRFDYLTTEEERWEKDYVLPDALSIWTDRFNTRTDTETKPINSSKQVMSTWFDGLIEKTSPARKQREIFIRYFITGEVGSGKSTLLKKGIRDNYERFRRAKVIPARVEFSKLPRSAPKLQKDDVDVLRLAIIDALYRDIHHIFKSNESFVAHPNFKPFKRYIVDFYIAQNGPGDIDEIQRKAEEFADFNLAQARRFYEMSRKERKTHVFQTNIIFKQLCVRYVHEKLDFDFLAIFDGFDYLSAADYLYSTPASNQISNLSTTHHGSNSFPLLEEIYSPMDFHHIYIMRDVTYARYIETHPTIFSTFDRRHFRIIGPSSKALVARAIARVCSQLNQPDLSPKVWEFDKFMRRTLRASITKGDRHQSEKGSISAVDAIAPLNLFNGNARLELSFLRFMIELLVLEILPYVDPSKQYADSLSDLFSIVQAPEFRREIETKRYRFLSLLLCRNTSSFRNSLMLGPDDAPNAIMERDDGTGNFIDNIFNYDESNQCQFALLGKIRVCELVRQDPMTRKEIVDAIGDEYTNDIDRLLATMCRTGLLKTRWKNDSVLFQTEPAGLICIDHLVHKTEYIEYVFPHIALPKGVRKLGLSAYDRERTSSPFWARASLVNSFLLLKYIEWLEDKERRSGKTWNWIAPRLREHHVDTTLRTVKRFSDGRMVDQINSFLKGLY